MANIPILTAKSRIFRQKAAQFSRLAEAESDPEKIFSFIQQALSWIQVAENEEALSASESLAPDVFLRRHDLIR